jgi:hypothetical protein|nr:MAG TPA: hypothetical protein [Caudoviricetes sp.]
MEKIRVISKHQGPISVNIPDLRFKREWPNKGASVLIERETLEEMMYDSGFKYMIDTGMLYIEDLEVKKELGLEPEDATEPVNIIVLSDNDMKRMMTAMPQFEFDAKLKTLNYEQMLALADFAIKNELGDFGKCDAIKKACGKDILTAIRLNREDKEG